MWQTKEPNPVKLIVGILAADRNCLTAAVETLSACFGPLDLQSDAWPFTQTDYYNNETGENILRQFASVDKLIDPGELAGIKHKTNKLEQKLARRLCGGLAKKLNLDLPRPVNLDPGIIEPSKLILATTKNYSHRIYIGEKMYAEVTLIFDKGRWQSLPYTYPDYKQPCYHDFFTKVRTRLLQQLRTVKQ
jgi:hypothetical protein